MSSSTTGLDKVVALVRMAVRGEQAAIDVVRENALFWASNWPIIRHRVLRDRDLWQLPEDTQARLDELALHSRTEKLEARRHEPGRAVRNDRPPRLPAGTATREVLAACARYAATLGDATSGRDALIRAAGANGVTVDPDLARKLLMRTLVRVVR